MPEITVNVDQHIAGLLHEGSYKYSFVTMGQIEGGRYDFFKPFGDNPADPPTTEVLEGFLGGCQMWCKTASDAILLMAFEESEGFDTMLMVDLADTVRLVTDNDDEDDDEDEWVPNDTMYVIATKRPFPLSYVVSEDGLVHIYDDEWMTLCGAGPTKDWKGAHSNDPETKADHVCKRCHTTMETQCHYPHSEEVIMDSVRARPTQP